jgi:hypothetical protein
MQVVNDRQLSQFLWQNVGAFSMSHWPVDLRLSRRSISRTTITKLMTNGFNWQIRLRFAS